MSTRLDDEHRLTTARDELRVRGGRDLAGEVRPGGFKHSFVTAVAASLLGTGDVRLHNVPVIAETRALKKLVSSLGGRVEQPDPRQLVITCDALRSGGLDQATARSIHGSVYLVPGLLARHGEVAFPESGGCQIGDGSGARPVTQYLDVLRRFGVSENQRSAGLFLSADRLVATDIDLADYTADRRLLTGPLYSGATKTAILAAALAEGTSVLRNPYPKFDVLDLVSVLRGMGAGIERDERGDLVVEGTRGKPLGRSVSFGLSADLIEVVTWVTAGALGSAEGIRITGPGVPEAVRGLAAEMQVMERLGVDVAFDGTGLLVRRRARLRPVDVLVHSHGVFSDSQPFFALLATLADGTSRITETVWTRRFSYIGELRKLGVRATASPGAVVVSGGWHPAEGRTSLHAEDLRAAAALLLAAVVTDRETVLSGMHHLDRGYENLPQSLERLGADVH